MTSPISSARTAFLACLALASTGPVLAQGADQDIVVRGRKLPEGTEQRVVKIGDLDLRNEAGTREMEQRVRRAVESICDKASSAALQEQIADKKCRDGAWASARPQMDRAIQLARAGQ